MAEVVLKFFNIADEYVEVAHLLSFRGAQRRGICPGWRTDESRSFASLRM